MNDKKFENDMKELVALQAMKMSEQYTIIDFANQLLENIKNKKLIYEAGINVFHNLEEEYNKFIIETSTQMVEDLFCKHVEEFINKKEENKEIIEEIKDLDELEEIEEDYYNEEEVPDDDLNYVISIQIRDKNIKILKEQGKYPEESTENYWMIGIDINSCSEQELQEMSIFDKDFW